MKKIIKSTVLILLSVVLVSMSFTGCNKQKELIVYTDPNFKPFEFTQGTQVVGVDMQIAAAIAKKMNEKLVIKSASFDGIVASIQSGMGDIAISGFTITSERKKSVDFSDPYITSSQYLILPNDSSIKTMQDLAGKKVGVATGYTGSFLMDTETSTGVLKGKNTTVKNYSSAIDGSLDITNNNLDAVVMDQLVAESIAKGNSKLKAIKLVYADGSNTDEQFGVIIKKGKTAELNTINEVVDGLVKDGSIAKWSEQYSK